MDVKMTPGATAALGATALASTHNVIRALRALALDGQK